MHTGGALLSLAVSPNVRRGRLGLGRANRPCACIYVHMYVCMYVRVFPMYVSVPVDVCMYIHMYCMLDFYWLCVCRNGRLVEIRSRSGRRDGGDGLSPIGTVDLTEEDKWKIYGDLNED